MNRRLASAHHPLRLAFLLGMLVCSPLLGQSRLAIVSGTLIDVSNEGRSTNDLSSQTILVEDGEITAVGPSSELAVPKGFMTIDAAGKFLTPGLIDGFAVLNNQAYAHANLAMGVTTLVAVSGGRRGPLFRHADPSPTLYRLEDVGYEKKSEDELIARVEEIAADGARVALLMYRLTPEKLRKVARRARELGLATIGELAQSRYVDGANCGIDAFVHTTRYSLGMADEEMVAGIAKEPFSDRLDSPKWRYYRWLSQLDEDSPRIGAYAERIAASQAFLIPTAGLLHLHQPGARNPWSFPAARLIDPKDVNMPADKESGVPAWSPSQLKAYRSLALATEHIEKANRKAGCRYLAGSGCDVWGTMPGISLHTELQALVRYGLSPREALAAATSNFAKAYHWPEVGEIRAGCRADILILDSDPREDVAHLQAIHRVIVKGCVLDPKTLLRGPGAGNGEILSSKPWVRPKAYQAEGYDYLDTLQVETMQYRSNAWRVAGVIARPKAPGKYPCVIDLRGGNREFGRISDWSIARRIGRIASWGYVVVSTQYRGVAGGTGREEFGGAEVHDVLNLIPLLEGLPEADAQRIGLHGGSRGGMMTYLALKASGRFQAAVVRAGLSDLKRWRRERPGIESVLKELIPGYAKRREEVLNERSAINWVDQLKSKAPILIFHGTADWRILPGSSLSLADALIKAKHPFRLVMLEGSDHGLSEHRAEVSSLTKTWLDRYLRDGKPAPDLKPHGR